MEAIGLLRSISGVGSCVGGGNRCLARALTPPFALGENTKRGGWGEHGEHRARRKAFYNTNQQATLSEVLDYAKFLDDEFGHLFIPSVR